MERKINSELPALEIYQRIMKVLMLYKCKQKFIFLDYLIKLEMFFGRVEGEGWICQ